MTSPHMPSPHMTRRMCAWPNQWKVPDDADQQPLSVPDASARYFVGDDSVGAREWHRAAWHSQRWQNPAAKNSFMVKGLQHHTAGAEVSHMRAIPVPRNTLSNLEIHHELNWQDEDVCTFGTKEACVDSILQGGIAAAVMGRWSTKRNDVHLVEGSSLGREQRDGVRAGSEVEVGVEVNMARWCARYAMT